MIIEQLVTAGTITEIEVWKLRRRYSNLLKAHQRALSKEDLENPPVKPGLLKIGYFHKMIGETGAEEPVKSHLKMVVVDGKIVVLGSGNMDRASWFTSQELGIAFLGQEVARIKEAVEEGLEGRVEYIC